MKYVLVKDGKVFAGPNDWNIGLFQAYIEQDFGIQVALPADAPASNTDLGNDITVYESVYKGTLYDPKTQRMDGPFYTFTDVATQTYNVVDKPIEQIKNELLATIANNRYDAEVGGATITIQGHNLLIDTSREFRGIYLQAIQANKDGATWKLAEITQVITPPVRPNAPSGRVANKSTKPRLVLAPIWLTLSLAELGSIVTAVELLIQTAFDWEATTAAAIMACNDPAALDAVVLTYPTS